MKLIKYTEDFRAIALLFLSTFLLISPLFGIFASIYWVPLKVIFSIICHSLNHNHQHLNIFNSEKLNSLTNLLLSINIGQSSSSTIAMHQLNHHKYNNSELDLANSRHVNYHWNLLNLLFYPFIIIINYRKKKNHILVSLDEKRQGIKYKVLTELWAIRFFLVIYLILDWKLFLLFVLIPYICGVWAILAINLIQHQLTNENYEFEHSTNFTGNTLNYFLLNNGYHEAHHQFPNIHWSLLPIKHKEIEKNISPIFIKKSLIYYITKNFIFSFSDKDRKQLSRKTITKSSTNKLNHQVSQ